MRSPQISVRPKCDQSQNRHLRPEGNWANQTPYLILLIGLHFSTVCCLSERSDWKRMVNHTPYIICHWPQTLSLLVWFQSTPSYTNLAHNQLDIHKQFTTLWKCPWVIERAFPAYWFCHLCFLGTENAHVYTLTWLECNVCMIQVWMIIDQTHLWVFGWLIPPCNSTALLQNWCTKSNEVVLLQK